MKKVLLQSARDTSLMERRLAGGEVMFVANNKRRCRKTAVRRRGGREEVVKAIFNFVVCGVLAQRICGIEAWKLGES